MGNHRWSRGVSIIGAANTPFGSVLETPSIRGMTFRELLSWAALEALENAGLTPKDVDSLVVAHYQAEPVKTESIQAVAAEWLGLKRKPSVRYETACSSGISGLRLAGSLIASGLDDIVLVVGAEITSSVMDDDIQEYRKQPAVRLPIDPDLQSDYVLNGFDQAYMQPIAAHIFAGLSAFPALAYARQHNLTVDQLDEAQCAAAINLRRNAARNPRAAVQKEYAETALEAGFTDVMKYMRSPFNPFVAWPLRTCHLSYRADGGAAYVLCPAEDAKKYTQKPIDVAGVGIASGLIYEADPLNITIEQAAFEQAYSMSGLNPKYIDYLALHDCFVHQHLSVPEMAGYLAPGEAWKAVIEGRTAFDGDKPINTHGGCPSCGNPYDVSGIAEIAETFRQMRGECDKRQIDPPPKCTVQHALGAGPSFGVAVLKARE